MDSRLLNAFHDDSFEDNFDKYENDTEFWNIPDEEMGLQLTETLDGILPISPTHITTIKEEFIKEPKHQTIAKTLQNRNALLCDDFVGPDIGGDGIEFITINNDELNDNRSQYSNSTFRTRTDSSSIGDYESHTSDYSDSDFGDAESEEINGVEKGATEYYDSLDLDAVEIEVSTEEHTSNIFQADNIMFDSNLKLSLEDVIGEKTLSKMRTLSTNTIASDVDGFGLQIDANNFDLAEFITKDDFDLSSPTKLVKKPINAIEDTTIKAPVVVLKSCDDLDSESDSIVDVETVEFDSKEQRGFWEAKIVNSEYVSNDSTLAYLDNVKSDPPWQPDENIFSKKTEKNAKMSKEQTKPTKPTVNVSPSTSKPSANSTQNFGRNFSVVPSKKQCDFLRGKFGGGIRGKGNLISRNSKCATPKKSDTVGVSSDGRSKNVEVLKQGQPKSNSEHSSGEQKRPEEQEQQKQQHQQSPNIKQVPVEAKTSKRKLNLEEYKQRRVENCTTSTEILPNSTTPKLEPHNVNGSKTTPHKNNASTKRSEDVTIIVKSLKEPAIILKAAMDPITAAKNKVLRMQQAKLAKQLKILDSTLSAKVPRVTKLLPLKEIVKESYCAKNNKKITAALETKAITPLHKTQPEYEEIIIVSASSNTDISIPPHGLEHNHKNSSNPMRSVLKSSALLSNISNTFQRVQQGNENMKISHNSLIASIQDVVVKQTMPLVKQSKAQQQIPEEHGENKIIMHLKKDGKRQDTRTSVATQTDIQPEFPFLPLSPLEKRQSPEDRKVRSRQRSQRRRRRNSSNSSSKSNDTNNSRRSYRWRSRSHNRTIINVDGRTCDAGGYSSRSTRRHRSSISSSSESTEPDTRDRSRRKRRTNYKDRTRRDVSRSESYSSSSTSYSSTLSDYSGRSRERSRTRSRSPLYQRSQLYNNRNYVDRNVSQPAVEERRIVYVGRIEEETTKEMLRRKFLAYGKVKQITIHYKETTGMKYGFVTYERSEDAFNVIDKSTRDPQISMYDISFGGRRAFCRASYADLDNAGINTYQSYVFPKAVVEPKEDDSFEALLRKVKAKMTANRTTNAATEIATSDAQI